MGFHNHGDFPVHGHASDGVVRSDGGSAANCIDPDSAGAASGRMHPEFPLLDIRVFLEAQCHLVFGGNF